MNVCFLCGEWLQPWDNVRRTCGEVVQTLEDMLAAKVIHARCEMAYWNFVRNV